jgi:uncharacterized membrane protein
VLGLFAASWWLCGDAPASPNAVELALSFVAVALAFVTGWLEGELVERLGVGVDNGAHLDAPSSLTNRHA